MAEAARTAPYEERTQRIRTTTPDEDTAIVSLRIPMSLARRLDAVAKHNKRSRSSEIWDMVERGVKSFEQISPA